MIRQLYLLSETFGPLGLPPSSFLSIGSPVVPSIWTTSNITTSTKIGTKLFMIVRYKMLCSLQTSEVVCCWSTESPALIYDFVTNLIIREKHLVQINSSLIRISHFIVDINSVHVRHVWFCTQTRVAKSTRTLSLLKMTFVF